MEAINGVSCIKGEIHSIVTLMRIHTRWSMQGRTSREITNFDEDPIMQSFRKLNEYLEGLYDLREVDCVTYISPFHQVIVSDKASGFLTSTSLSSIAKFVSYGFLRPEFPRVREGISMIANCIQRCIFEETDWESDEVILMKLLELAALCLRCDASLLLTIGDVWGIYETCISIHSTKASKILRSEAETALRNLTLTIFSRAHAALQAIISQTPTEFMGSSVDNSAAVRRMSTDFVFPPDIRGQSWEQLGASFNFEGPVGVTLLLTKIMTVLSSLMDSQSQPANEVKFALSLVNIALESGGPALGSMGPLVDVLRGDVCRHLLRATQSDDLAVFSFSLRVVFNLFVSIKDHMKIQLEVFLTSVHLRLLSQSQQSQQVLQNSSIASLFTPLQTAREELALESLLEFCREPSLMQDLYSNYDCDVQCTNLFDCIITALCARAIPSGIHPNAFNGIHDVTITDLGGSSGARGRFILIDPYHICRISILNKLALDGVFAVLHAVAGRCAAHPVRGGSGGPHSHKETDCDDLTASSIDGESSRADQQQVSFTNGFVPVATSAPASAVGATGKDPGPTTPLGRRAAHPSAEGVESDVSSPDKPGQERGISNNDAQVDDWCSRDIEDVAGITPPPSNSNYSTGSGIGMQPQSMAFPQSENGGNQRERGSIATSPLTAEALASLAHPSTLRSIESPNVSATEVEINAAASRQQYGYGNVPVPIHFAIRQPTLLRGSSSPFSSTDAMSINGDDDVDGMLLARAKTAEELRQRKLKKQRLKLAAEKFNEKPLSPDWVRFALSLGLLQPATHPPDPSEVVNAENDNASTASSMKDKGSEAGRGDNTPGTGAGTVPKKLKNKSIAFAIVEPKSVAKFLKNTPGLGKTQIGEFLSKGPKEMYPFHAHVLHEYVRLFDFKPAASATFDQPLRTFLGFFRLPGEAQCIDRLMEAFAQKLFHDLGPNNPFASADAAFILAFSTIMLNTDLHNPQIAHNKRMTKDEFIRNNRQINDGKDLPREYMESLYDEIKNRQIQVDLGINDSDVGVPVALDYTDTATWNKLLRKSAQDQAPAAFTPTVAARKGAAGRSRGSILPPSVQERDMFLVMAKPVFEAMLIAWEVVDDDQLLCRLIQGIRDFASVCMSLGFNGMLSRLVQILADRAVAVLVSVRLPSKAQSAKPGTTMSSKMSSDSATLNRNKTSFFRLLETDLGTIIRRPAKSKSPTSQLSPDAVDANGSFQRSAANAQQPRQRSSSGANNVDVDETLDWTGAHRLRGEMMMKVAFHVARCYSAALGPEAWAAMARLLLYIRGRGALPPALAIISEDVQQMAIDGFGLSPSVFALDCHALAKNAPATAVRRLFSQIRAGAAGGSSEQKEGDRDKGGSIWSSVASLGGLFWSSGSGNTQPKGSSAGAGPASGPHAQVALTTGADKNRRLSVGEYSLLSGGSSDRVQPSGSWIRLDANSCLFNNRLNPYVNDGTSSQVGGIYVSAAVALQDELLRVGIHACQPDALFFESAADLDAVALQGTIDSLVDVLTDIVNTLINRPTVGIGAGISSGNVSNTSASASATAPANVTGSGVIVNVQPVGVSSGMDDSPTSQGSPVTPSGKATDAQQQSQHVSITLTRCELDAVILLEWLTDLIFVSNKHLETIWPKVHGFFRSILEDKIDGACVACPYFVERCIVAILRAASHLLPTSQALEATGSGGSGGGATSSSAAGFPNQFKLRSFESPSVSHATKSLFGAVSEDYSLTPSSRISGLHSLWLSIRLIRAVPNEILWVISDHLAAGMLSLLKVSPGAAAITTLEQWYMVFSLLSAASAGPAGRPLVWEAICYLIDSNAVNDMNFTPCRHLLLRFLHGAFPGDISDAGRARSLSQPQAQKQISPWQSSALFHLMRLTNMAMAGYARSHQTNGIKPSASQVGLSGTMAGTGKGELLLSPTSVSEVPPKPSKPLKSGSALAPFDDPSRLSQAQQTSAAAAATSLISAAHGPIGNGIRGVRGSTLIPQPPSLPPAPQLEIEVVSFPLPPRHFSSHRISLAAGAGALPVKTQTFPSVSSSTPSAFLGTSAPTGLSAQSPGVSATHSTAVGGSTSPSLAGTERASFRGISKQSSIPGYGESSTSNSGDWPTDSYISVVSVRFARDEEVELLWLETAKAFADVSHSLSMESSKKAIFCLEAICLSGRIAGLPEEIWIRAVAELLNRLPLSVSVFTQNLAPVDHSDATDCCLRCCNIIFEMFVANLRPLKQHSDFQSYWLRFTGLLATNLNTVDRWSQVYDEILEMIAALMRLLQPLPQAQAPSTPAAATATGNVQVAMAGVSGGAAGGSLSGSSVTKQKEKSKGGGGGLFGLLMPLWGTSTGSDAENGTDGISSGSSAQPARRPSSPSSSSAGLQAPTTPMQVATMATSADASLIALSWRSMCSQCPSLASTLKTKNAQLTADLTNCVEAVPLDAAAVAAAASITSVNSPVNVQIRPGAGAMDSRLASNAVSSALYMPPTRRPSHGSDSGYEESRKPMSQRSHANLATVGIAATATTAAASTPMVPHREVAADGNGSAAPAAGGKPPIHRNIIQQKISAAQSNSYVQAQNHYQFKKTGPEDVGKDPLPTASTGTSAESVGAARNRERTIQGLTPEANSATGSMTTTNNHQTDAAVDSGHSGPISPLRTSALVAEDVPKNVESSNVTSMSNSSDGDPASSAIDTSSDARLVDSGTVGPAFVPGSIPVRQHSFDRNESFGEDKVASANGATGSAGFRVGSYNSAFTEVRTHTHPHTPPRDRHDNKDDDAMQKIHISALSPGMRNSLRKEIQVQDVHTPPQRGSFDESRSPGRYRGESGVLSTQPLGESHHISHNEFNEPDAAAFQHAISTAANYARQEVQEEGQEEGDHADNVNTITHNRALVSGGWEPERYEDTTEAHQFQISSSEPAHEAADRDECFNAAFWGPDPSQFNNSPAYHQPLLMHIDGKRDRAGSGMENSTTLIETVTKPAPATLVGNVTDVNASTYAATEPQLTTATATNGHWPVDQHTNYHVSVPLGLGPSSAAVTRDAKMRRINARTMVV